MDSKIILGGFFANVVALFYLEMLPPLPTTALQDFTSLDIPPMTTVEKESLMYRAGILFPTKYRK